jgi:multiple sugar transport system substrate-binding protein
LKSQLVKKAFIVSLSFIILVISAGSSLTNRVSASPSIQADTKQTLKVMYQNKSFFDVNQFKQQFPNVEIKEVGWDGKSDLKDFISKQSPDVIMLNTLDYKKLSKQNQLADLGQFIKRDHYDTASIYPGLLDALKVNGKLGGLTPIFETQSIFYNADLFKKYNVPLPKDGMTWEEILKLAAKFPTGGTKNTRIWGLQYPLDKYTYLINDIADAEGLARYNPNTLKATINTASWKKVYGTAITAIKSNAIEGSNVGGKSYSEDPFIMGRAAMKIDSSSIEYLRRVTADKKAIANYKPFTVKIAAGPADPKDRTTTRSLILFSIMAIPANSANQDLAWDFIKFYNGVDYAKFMSEQPLLYSLTRMDYSKEYNGINLGAFYKLKPNLETSRYLQPQGSPFNQIVYSNVLNREVKQVISNKKTLDKALVTIQTEVQKSLDDAVKKQKK